MVVYRGRDLGTLLTLSSYVSLEALSQEANGVDDSIVDDTTFDSAAILNSIMLFLQQFTRDEAIWSGRHRELEAHVANLGLRICL